MIFLIGEVHGNIAAYCIQLLTDRHIILEVLILPPHAIDGFCACFFCPLDGIGNNFRKELVNIIFWGNHRSNGLYSISGQIMRVAVAARGHHQSFPGIVHHLGFSFFHKGGGSLLIPHIDIPAILYGKCLCHPISLGSEYLATDHEVGIGPARRKNIFIRQKPQSSHAQCCIFDKLSTCNVFHDEHPFIAVADGTLPT